MTVEGAGPRSHETSTWDWAWNAPNVRVVWTRTGSLISQIEVRTQPNRGGMAVFSVNLGNAPEAATGEFTFGGVLGTRYYLSFRTSHGGSYEWYNDVEEYVAGASETAQTPVDVNTTKVSRRRTGMITDTARDMRLVKMGTPQVFASAQIGHTTEPKPRLSVIVQDSYASMVLASTVAAVANRHTSAGVLLTGPDERSPDLDIVPSDRVYDGSRRDCVAVIRGDRGCIAV